MNIIFECLHGSDLFGLNTAKSDKDYKFPLKKFKKSFMRNLKEFRNYQII